MMSWMRHTADFAYGLGVFLVIAVPTFHSLVVIGDVTGAAHFGELLLSIVIADRVSQWVNTTRFGGEADD